MLKDFKELKRARVLRFFKCSNHAALRALSVCKTTKEACVKPRAYPQAKRG